MESNIQEDIPGKNPWQEQLEKQGMNFSIPDRYRDALGLPFPHDEKTGLIIESDLVRTDLASRLSDSIRHEKTWTMVHADSDNLKVANTKVNHLFGDMVIKYGAATLTQAIDRAKIGSNVKIFATRDAHAGDEFSIWLFYLSDDEINKVRHEINNISAIKTKDPEFNFSISSAMIAYNDPRIQENINQTKKFLAKDKNVISYNFYQHSVKEIAENDVGKIKIEKDLDRLKDLPEEQLLTSINMGKFIKSIVDTFGNSRLSDKLLDVLLKLSSAQTAIIMSNKDDSKNAYKLLLEGVGVTKEQIENAKTSNDLLNIFRSLFGS
jgi:GGDEF domain-containing protein